MEVQQRISTRLNEAKTGNVYKTVIDRIEGDYYIGRTEYDSPEVDCEVLIEKRSGSKEEGEKRLKVGEFYIVTIQKTEDFDLYASL